MKCRRPPSRIPAVCPGTVRDYPKPLSGNHHGTSRRDSHRHRGTDAGPERWTKRVPQLFSWGKPLVYEIVVAMSGPSLPCACGFEDVLRPARLRYRRTPGNRGRRTAQLGAGQSAARWRTPFPKSRCKPSAEGEWIGNASVTVATSSSLRTRVTRSSLTLTMTGPEKRRRGPNRGVPDTRVQQRRSTVTGLVLRDRCRPGPATPLRCRAGGRPGHPGTGKTRTINLTRGQFNRTCLQHRRDYDRRRSARSRPTPPPS